MCILYIYIYIYGHELAGPPHAPPLALGPRVGMVGGAPPPLWLWLGLGGMKRHDLRSSPLSCRFGWVWVSQVGDLRKPFVSLCVTGMREDIYMTQQDYV